MNIGRSLASTTSSPSIWLFTLLSVGVAVLSFIGCNGRELREKATRAQEFLKEGKNEAAIAVVNEVLEASPRDEARVLRACAYAASDHFDEAATDIKFIHEEKVSTTRYREYYMTALARLGSHYYSAVSGSMVRSKWNPFANSNAHAALDCFERAIAMQDRYGGGELDEVDYQRIKAAVQRLRSFLND